MLCGFDCHWVTCFLPEKPPVLVGGDINEKFAKLNQDYLRIKSQNAILKKAVVQVSSLIRLSRI